MLLAVKTGLWYVSVGLFVVLLFTSKSKLLLMAALIGLGVAIATGSFGALSFNAGDSSTWIILGGLFVVLLILAKSDSEAPAQQGFYGGGGY